MRQFFHFLIFLPVTVILTEYEGDGRFLRDPELSHIPQDILNCYTDMNLWDRYHRLPISIESLVAIIRKAELHPSVRSWTPGEILKHLPNFN